MGEVGVGEERWVEADETGDEDGVVELDGPAEARGGVDPVVLLGRLGWLMYWEGGSHCASMVLSLWKRDLQDVLCNGWCNGEV